MQGTVNACPICGRLVEWYCYHGENVNSKKMPAEEALELVDRTLRRLTREKQEFEGHRRTLLDRCESRG